MSLWSKLIPSREVLSHAIAPTELPLASPWSTGSLTRIAVSELLGLPNSIVTRTDAMKIPAVVRGRGLIAGTLARFPLSLWSFGSDESLDRVLPPPPWMSSTQVRQSPRMRMLWTIDDLLFSGLSLWALKRDDQDQVVDAVRVPPEYWSVDPDSLGVLVGGKPVSAEEVCLFEGPQEGLISLAEDAIRASLGMANAWKQRVVSPVPLVELHSTDANNELDSDEIDDAITQWEAARQAGGTAFTPSWIETKMHGEAPTDLYVEGRNAERLDWGNYLNIPATMLDGSMSTASLTYSTQEGRNSEFVDYSLAYWRMPIEARLSADDITPPDSFVRFNLTSLVSPVQLGVSPRSED